MSPRSRTERIADAVDEPSLTDDQVRWYIDRLLSQWQENERSLTRLAALLVVTVAAFFLLQSNGISEVSVGFAKVVNVAVVQLALPVFVAYLFYSLSVLFIDVSRSRFAFHNIMVRRFPGMTAADLDVRLYPGGSLYMDQIKLLGNSGRVPGPRVVPNIVVIGALLRPVGATVAVPSFLVYAQIYLFAQPGYTVVKLIAALLVAYWVAAGMASVVLGISMARLTAKQARATEEDPDEGLDSP